jgi:hypothetical protein
MTERRLMLVNAGFRIAYGIGGLLSPRQWRDCSWRRTPPNGPMPGSSFAASAHQIGVAALGLASLPWRRLERPAALAAVQ